MGRRKTEGEKLKFRSELFRFYGGSYMANFTCKTDLELRDIKEMTDIKIICMRYKLWHL